MIEDRQKAALFIVIGLSNQFFKEAVLRHIKQSGDIDWRRFSTWYRPFMRMLMVCYASPSPVPFDTLSHLVFKAHVTLYMMVGCGWLVQSGRRKHVTITKKGIALVEECIKMVEREYSTFYLDQERIGEEIHAKSLKKDGTPRKSNKKPLP